MSNSGRPLSPHLSIYRWPITMTLSILHRTTGVALTVGLVAYAGWLMSAAGDPAGYAGFVDIMQSPLGRIALVGWSAAFFFHFANGIRHLIWDAGRGFEKAQANASSWFVVAVTVALTLSFWWLL